MLPPLLLPFTPHLGTFSSIFWPSLTYIQLKTTASFHPMKQKASCRSSTNTMSHPATIYSQVLKWESIFWQIYLFLPCVRLHINNSVFPYHSASMQLISWKMLMLREIQVLVHLLFPEWPQPSLAIFSKATVSERETCHLLPSLQIISFILLTAQVTCRLWVSSKEHVCIFSFQTTATHHYL